MFRPTGHFGGAGARYRNIEVNSRVDGASPHKLIAILFEELLRCIEATRLAMERGDASRQADRQARALSILQALDGSLDHEKGGEVAANLSTVYRAGCQLIALGTRQKSAEPLTRAHAMLAEIASAWETISN